jgi:hypothetical protein
VVGEGAAVARRALPAWLAGYQRAWLRRERDDRVIFVTGLLYAAGGNTDDFLPFRVEDTFVGAAIARRSSASTV